MGHNSCALRQVGLFASQHLHSLDGAEWKRSHSSVGFVVLALGDGVGQPLQIVKCVLLAVINGGSTCRTAVERTWLLERDG